MGYTRSCLSPLRHGFKLLIFELYESSQTLLKPLPRGLFGTRLHVRHRWRPLTPHIYTAKTGLTWLSIWPQTWHCSIIIRHLLNYCCVSLPFVFPFSPWFPFIMYILHILHPSCRLPSVLSIHICVFSLADDRHVALQFGNRNVSQYFQANYMHKSVLTDSRISSVSFFSLEELNS